MQIQKIMRKTHKIEGVIKVILRHKRNNQKKIQIGKRVTDQHVPRESHFLCLCLCVFDHETFFDGHDQRDFLFKAKKGPPTKN